MTNNKGISVVIPNYNGRELLPQILPPLFNALISTGLAYEIIVSDDCSADGSVAWLQANHPDIKILTADVNSGFSPTANKGIFAAQYDLIFLMNSDVKLEPGYFEKQLYYFERPDTFGVMGRIIGWDDDQIQDGGKYPGFHAAKIKTSGNYIPQNENEAWLPSMYLSGANALISRQKITALKGFDEIFAPFYVEDFELSMRAWRLGWKCYYEHNAVCRHKTSVTIKQKSRKNFVKGIYYRNKMYLHAIHLEKGQRILWYLQLLPEMLLHLCTGRFWFFRSLSMFFSSAKKIKRSKENLRALSIKENQCLSVKAVAGKVLSLLGNRPVIRF